MFMFSDCVARLMVPKLSLTFFKAKVTCAFVCAVHLAYVLWAFAGGKECTIRKLNLRNNAIGSKGAAFIADILASAVTLEELNLSGWTSAIQICS